MQTNEILIAIDKEIAMLRQARELLAAEGEIGKRRGRSPGSRKGIATVGAKSSRRTMSEEGRARIAAGQKRRWAAQKKGIKKNTIAGDA